MYLIQVLLPLRDNHGHPFPKSLFKSVDADLVARFGGVTAFSRAPAKGKWLNRDEEQRDDVVGVVIERAVRDDFFVAVHRHGDAECESHDQCAKGLKVVE